MRYEQEPGGFFLMRLIHGAIYHGIMMEFFRDFFSKSVNDGWILLITVASYIGLRILMAKNAYVCVAVSLAISLPPSLIFFDSDEEIAWAVGVIVFIICSLINIGLYARFDTFEPKKKKHQKNTIENYYDRNNNDNFEELERLDAFNQEEFDRILNEGESVNDLIQSAKSNFDSGEYVFSLLKSRQAMEKLSAILYYKKGFVYNGNLHHAIKNLNRIIPIENSYVDNLHFARKKCNDAVHHSKSNQRDTKIVLDYVDYYNNLVNSNINI